MRCRCRRSSAIALFSYGVFASNVEVVVRVTALVVGVLLMFVAVAMIATRVVRPLAFVLGAPGARFGGTPGSLARQNAVRNPARTASTAAAVMIGLALITFVAVIGQGFKTSFTGAVDELFVADYSVSAGNTDALLTNKAAQAVAKAPGVEAVSEMRSGEAKADGKTAFVTGVDANLPKVVTSPGRTARQHPAQLGQDGAFDQAVRRRPLADRRVGADGQDARGQGLRLHVDGIVDPPKGGSPFGEVSVSTATFDSAYADHDNDLTLLNIDGGPSAENTAALEESLAAFPAAVVETREEFKDTRTAEITQSLQILYALLGLSVIVSLFGVINTLVLSVFERTREAGDAAGDQHDPRQVHG
jgi:putative ABC transport system permease protein